MTLQRLAFERRGKKCDPAHETAVVTGDEERHRLRYGVDERIDPGPIGFGKIAQHVIGHHALVTRVADSDAHPAKIRPDMGVDADIGLKVKSY